MKAATLERVESFLPERSVRIEDLADRLGLRRAELGVFRKFYGLDRLRFDPDLSLLDLLKPAALRALAALPAGRRVDYVVFAHTTQTLTPPDIEMAQVIRDELGLAGADAFALSQQACVSSLGAIDVAAELLRSDGDGYALVVCGEQAFAPGIQLIPNSAIMADAAAACLVTLDGAGDVVHSFVTRTYGEYAEWSTLSPARSVEFGELYGERLAAIIKEAVLAAGLTFDEIARVLPHNVNMLAWRQTIKVLGAPPEKFFLDNISRFSHTYTADVFVNYTTMREAGLLVDGERYVLASVGLGATFGAMVITYREAT
ncbi:3-oxoacyl-[acyl-carrier-protein] synthase III C-terminal domain-containing protein [Actinocrispum wychmicini]|uniref:3-oxoacyl-[acyl-carrier-protein] synthase-3 n=1 Tax=Actinocrispum wychmicini TaxID=1213861 RepID=A0A4R2ILH3_9PSEU|nr:3-oxoacyl-[acyl-carrier-protein] synthase III C-terminal domain-containing protein [Actinocrispum wychmicini]TCO44779.1 3-oxoacyl-[acyl-carrier-protein] synthase-3 [Actinocrispum wychmicini]